MKSITLDPHRESRANRTQASDGLRFHWPEYAMEAGESGLYLFSVCGCHPLVASRFANPKGTWRAMLFAGS